MHEAEYYLKRLKRDLKEVSTPEKAASARRYFPDGIHCIGATAGDIRLIIKNFQLDNADLSAGEMLAIAECVLAQAEYSEEFMVAFGLINKFVKNHYGDELLQRFEFWLESYANNWALVDDLCIKTIYQFFLGRPYLIEQIQHWAHSDISWCRRASNVAWVKFIKRKMGKDTYYLDQRLVFENCNLLLGDSDPYVQKSVGWLLKATSLQHKAEVVGYIEANHQHMQRSTIRYAIEKMTSAERKSLLALV